MAASWPAGHAFEFAVLEVFQTDVFHCSSPLGGSQQHSLARWIVHPIVVAPEKIDSRGELFLFQFLEPPREKTALRFLPRQGERLLIRSTGLRNPP